MPAKKQCNDCGKKKPLGDFYRHPEGRDGYRGDCKKCFMAKHKLANYRWARNPKNWPKLRAHVHRYYRRHAKEIGERRRRKRVVLRAEMLVAYGGVCACCGEREPAFLTLEHMNRDGAEHRRRLGGASGARVWRDLQVRGWPKVGYTLLCMNCNWSTRYGAPCPHKRRR